jgi:radical SAM protein with 4Fe4S-binding SPASM domain
MSIFSNGDVVACCRDWKHKTKYGSIHSNSLKELWESDALKTMRLTHLTKDRSQIPYCKNCYRRSIDDITGDVDVLIKKINTMKI